MGERRLTSTYDIWKLVLLSYVASAPGLAVFPVMWSSLKVAFRTPFQQRVPTDVESIGGAPPSWWSAFEDSARELAGVALGATEFEIRFSDEVPTGYLGGYLSIAGTNTAYLVGILSDERGCADLCRALLGMDTGAELAHTDVSDAVCEMVNILAGGAKRRLPHDESLKLGLPTFAERTIEPDGPFDAASFSARFGVVPAVIVVFRRALEP